MFLQNLARKKALEREAAARRLNKPQEDRERGFQMCFNGANKDLGKIKPRHMSQQQRPVTSGATGRLVRVAGAVPIATLQHAVDNERRTSAIGEEGAHSPSTAIVKRVRRQWVIGEPVLLRAADGEVLQADPVGREVAQLILRRGATAGNTAPNEGDCDGLAALPQEEHSACSPVRAVEMQTEEEEEEKKEEEEGDQQPGNLQAVHELVLQDLTEPP